MHLYLPYWHACPDGIYRACLATLMGTLVLAHASTWAQTAPPANVVDPAAVVQPTLYHSVFKDTPVRALVEETDWKKANAQVGQFKRGHIDILRWEDAEAAKAVSPQPMPFATKNIAPGAGSTEAKP